ncbi:MAG: hypothetical protein F6K11_37095 [Leptolyngbya sp. SIO3F4]|nr:hypothetical protein [Leptolyngbya sp. SIO3F4]
MNDRCFLALVVVIVLADSLATMHGQQMKHLRIDEYAGYIQKHSNKTSYHSDFSLGLYGQRWLYAMDIWAEWAFKLMALNPHKRLYFQHGLLARSLMEQSV